MYRAAAIGLVGEMLGWCCEVLVGTGEGFWKTVSNRSVQLRGPPALPVFQHLWFLPRVPSILYPTENPQRTESLLLCSIQNILDADILELQGWILLSLELSFRAVPLTVVSSCTTTAIILQSFAHHPSRSVIILHDQQHPHSQRMLYNVDASK